MHSSLSTSRKALGHPAKIGLHVRVAGLASPFPPSTKHYSLRFWSGVCFLILSLSLLGKKCSVAIVAVQSESFLISS